MCKPRSFPHNPALDGLRGLAALGVFLHHAVGLYVPPQGMPWHLALFQFLSLYGVYGVTLFFILSGYLITSLLLLDRRKSYYFHDFYWKRVFRVLPPLVLVLIVTFEPNRAWIETVVLALLFLANYSDPMGISLTGPYWSLSIEEQFYLIWPAMVRKLSSRAMRNTAIAMIVIEPLLRTISMAMGHGRIRYTFMQTDGLAWGALIALVAFRLRIPYRNRNQRRLWTAMGRPALVAGILLGIGSESVVYFAGHSTLYLTLEAAVLFFAGVITYVVTHPTSLLCRILSTKPLLFLGSISYMMYLIHLHFLEMYDKYLHPAVPFTTGVYIRTGITFAATLLFCTASLYLFERPVNRMRRFVLSKPGERIMPVDMEADAKAK